MDDQLISKEKWYVMLNKNSPKEVIGIIGVYFNKPKKVNETYEKPV